MSNRDFPTQFLRKFLHSTSELPSNRHNNTRAVLLAQILDSGAVASEVLETFSTVAPTKPLGNKVVVCFQQPYLTTSLKSNNHLAYSERQQELLYSVVPQGVACSVPAQSKILSTMPQTNHSLLIRILLKTVQILLAYQLPAQDLVHIRLRFKILAATCLVQQMLILTSVYLVLLTQASQLNMGFLDQVHLNQLHKMIGIRFCHLSSFLSAKSRKMSCLGIFQGPTCTTNSDS